MTRANENTGAKGTASAVLDEPVRPEVCPLPDGRGSEGHCSEGQGPDGLESKVARTILRFMPSLSDVAFLLPVVFLFAKLDGAHTMLGDGDTGWHIRAGEWMMRHHQVPTTDFFSFTMPGQKWYAWEWLWEVAFAGLHQMWGLAGVVWVSIVVLCATSALVYRLAYKNAGNPLVAIGLTALAMAGSSIHWLARPHLFTMLFTVVFLGMAQKARETGKNGPLWLLPLVTILWTNLHAGFLAGVIMLGAYAGGELVKAALSENTDERREAVKASLPYLLCAAGCLAASLVNPYTYHLHQHIVAFLNDPWQFKNIMEFQSANFRDGGAIYFEALLILAAFGAIWFARRKRYAEILLLAGWAHLALTTVRNIPIFVLTAAVILAEPIANWFDRAREAPVAEWARGVVRTFSEIGEELNPLERMGRIHVIPVLVLAGLALLFNKPAAGEKFQAEYNPKNYPAAALATVAQPGARIFADDEWGDYLVYNLWPKGLKVFVDGRSDFYGNKFDQEYIDAISVKYDWAKTLARYGVNTLLLRADAPLAGAVKESSKWRVVYDDGRAIVFRPATAVPAGREQVSIRKGGMGEGVAP